MSEIGDWFNQIPPITRFWFAGSIAIPLLARAGIISPISLVLTSDFLKNMEFWKPLTALLYYPIMGGSGLSYLMNLYFIYQYSQRLELGLFSGRPADYVFMLIFNWISLVCIAYLCGIIMLMNSMVMSVIYVYCMVNQNQIVSFWFGTRFKARYLPWALFGANFILGGGGLTDLVGIIIGHLYYFVTIQYPAEQGVNLIHTPQMLYSFFPSQNPTTYTAPSRPPRPTSYTTTSQQPNSPTGYQWGRGRRLDD